MHFWQNTWQSQNFLELPCNSHDGRRASLLICMSGLGFPVIDMCFLSTEPVRKQPAGICCGDLHGRLSITQNWRAFYKCQQNGMPKNAWQNCENAELTCLLWKSKAKTRRSGPAGFACFGIRFGKGILCLWEGEDDVVSRGALVLISL